MAEAYDYYTVAHKRGLNPQPNEVVVQDNGTGIFLAHWAERLGAKPTQAELNAVTQENRDDAASDTIHEKEKAILALIYHEKTGNWPNATERKRLRSDYITALKFVRSQT